MNCGWCNEPLEYDPDPKRRCPVCGTEQHKTQKNSEPSFVASDDTTESQNVTPDKSQEELPRNDHWLTRLAREIVKALIATLILIVIMVALVFLISGDDKKKQEERYRRELQKTQADLEQQKKQKAQALLELQKQLEVQKISYRCMQHGLLVGERSWQCDGVDIIIMATGVVGDTELVGYCMKSFVELPQWEQENALLMQKSLAQELTSEWK